MNSNRKSYSWQRVNCSYEKGLYMRIERVESLDKRKCKVFTDEDFAFLLYNGELEKYGVCEGAVLEERTERELLDLLSRRAHERALNLLKVQDRTEGEMCRRLFQDGYPGIRSCRRRLAFCRNIILWTMPDMRRITCRFMESGKARRN